MERRRRSAEPAEDDEACLIEELREAVRARDDFIAVAAHELRNPMTPVLLRVNSLAKSARSTDVPREALASGLEDLRLFVQNYVKRATILLDVSRITAGQLRLSVQPLDLSELVRRIVREAAPVARHVGSTLSARIEDGLRGVWDPFAVEQIVDNLLSNALKYGSGQPVEIELTSVNGSARLIVRDNGDGISPADQARIFQRFERAAMRPSGGGFGIGLWLVGRLVDAMEGRIVVESKIGSGSRFIVTLPLEAQN